LANSAILLDIQTTFKGKDSILAGLDIMKRYRIFITNGLLNLIWEFNNYKWKEDQAGKATNEPIDKFNQGITFGEIALLS